MDWVVVSRKGRQRRACSSSGTQALPAILPQYSGDSRDAAVKQPTPHAWHPAPVSHTGRGHPREPTTEERVQQLRCAVLDMKQKVARSQFYRQFLKQLAAIAQQSTEWTASAPEAEEGCSGAAAGASATCRPDPTAEAQGDGEQAQRALAETMQQMSLGSAARRAEQAAGVSCGAICASHAAAEPPQREEAVGGQAIGWRWEAVEQLVVYGLGSMEDSVVSRYQLAFALQLLGQLPGLRGPVLAFDPAFTEADRALLASLDIRVLDVNEQGSRPAACPTLFYLAHCEAVISENLLGANAGPARRARLAILGNSFAAYAERWAAAGSVQAQHRRQRPGKLLAAVSAGAVLEVPILDEGSPAPKAFNDMALHLFMQPRCGPPNIL